ncbi:lipoprotein insertase outer membrane protein LolB [Candidatus Erwinia haradaeae]|uniref:Outer-membrane lipoprotein LolB n=1 Tax=Candidatus Erwinia haradaeae TaxID=1922217 RepID=A0A451DA43_9GAMM|nr:lipoprotein insertase outer membrane protein LolB [Candidatus Erwinia haradaeae]VFP83171.1 Outer-membrane lipoprotein LolB precursor [Candidatus Erwinia haradaeae]
MMLAVYRFIVQFVFFSSSLLTACSQYPAQNPIDRQKITSLWPIHEKLVQQITHYQTHGTLSGFSGHHKIFIRFYWQQTSPYHYKLIFINPLGATELQLIQEGAIVQIMTQKAKYVISEKHAEQVIYKLTGMHISLENFRQWIMGLPGNSTDFKLYEQHLLRRVYFNDVSKRLYIVYLAYKKEFGLPLMPTRIEVHQDKKYIQLKID